jgi:hypothetical protein
MNYHSFNDCCQQCEKQSSCRVFLMLRMRMKTCGNLPGLHPPRLTRAWRNSRKPFGQRSRRRRKIESWVAADVSRRRLLKWRGLASAATKQRIRTIYSLLLDCSGGLRPSPLIPPALTERRYKKCETVQLHAETGISRRRLLKWRGLTSATTKQRIQPRSKNRIMLSPCLSKFTSFQGATISSVSRFV